MFYPDQSHVLRPSYRARVPTACESTRQARSLHHLTIFLIHLCYPEEPKTLKTVWEYYNEGALGVMYHITAQYLLRTRGMEIIDCESEKEWLEQMDTILIFVGLTPLWHQPELMGYQAALFAGFMSAFLIELLGRLEPDPIDIIQDVLIYQMHMMRNSSPEPYVPVLLYPYVFVVQLAYSSSMRGIGVFAYQNHSYSYLGVELISINM
jgi:hypothetical protein